MGTWIDEEGLRASNHRRLARNPGAEAPARPPEKKLQEGRVRRRIEDILEASRLERFAFGEVWHED